MHTFKTSSRHPSHFIKEEAAELMSYLYYAKFTLSHLSHDKVSSLSNIDNIRIKENHNEEEEKEEEEKGDEEEEIINVLDQFDVKFGIRTIKKVYNNVTQGPGFQIYLEGGNWITTDIFLRHANNKQRYFDEVLFHKKMGFNLIRVWGGGITERSYFYEACNELGMFVYQEFWMTGDNNGRWAGSYDWPLNHDDYIANVKDVILQIRSHPCLMLIGGGLIGGGNELYPAEQNPPPDISQRMYDLMSELAPATPFIMSSMSPQNTSLPFDWNYAMAPNDGNYGGNLLSKFYNDRNPGLTEYQSIPISFQPEIGSISAPSIRSLSRFLNKTALDNFPVRNANSEDIDVSWLFHKYEAFTTTNTEDGSTYDFVYAYGDHASASDWSMAATMVQYQQYQALFEGFASHAFEWYTTVIMWKSQSPWPGLRGCMYDSYLATTGGFWGVKHAISNNQYSFLQQQQQQSQKNSVENNVFKNSNDKINKYNEEEREDKNDDDDKELWWWLSKSLHVQINPLTMNCGVMNRGKTTFNLNITSQPYESSNTSYVVELSYHNLNGDILGQSQTRLLPTSLQDTSFSSCIGDSFSLPSVTSTSTILIELKLYATNIKEASLYTLNDAVDDDDNSDIKVILAQNRYWISVSPSSSSPSSSLSSSSSSPLSPSVDSSSVIELAPMYNDLAALRYGDSISPPTLVQLIGNGTASFSTSSSESTSSLKEVSHEHADGKSLQRKQNIHIIIDITYENKISFDKAKKEVNNDDFDDDDDDTVAFFVTVNLLNLKSTNIINDKNENDNEYFIKQNSYNDERILPTFWNDNHFWLYRGETKQLTATVPYHAYQQYLLPSSDEDAMAVEFGIEITGWNIQDVIFPLLFSDI